MSIYIHKNGQNEGPYDLDTIRQGVSVGRFSPDDFAFQDGCADWVPLRTLIPPTTQLPANKAQAISNQIDTKLEQIDSTLAGLLGDEQDPSVVEKVTKKARELLTKGEQIEYIAVQKKPLITIAPDAILLTNKRFMIVRPKMMGMTFEDHIWREVLDVHLSEQMLTATITCVVEGGKKLEIDSIPKKQARRIYSYAQEVEEHMHEVRRIREMEESRAAAGGIVFHAPAQMNAGAANNDPIEVLGKLKKLVEAGLIEASEYEAKKAEILGRM
jgi:ribosomal protein S19